MPTTTIIKPTFGTLAVYGKFAKSVAVGLAYRYGFNTQENSPEIYGVGNSTTAMFWEYDARLGRRWNLDPKPQIFISDYASFANNPILLTDHLGDKVKFAKEDGVSPKDFRQMKRNIRDLKNNSQTFNAIFKDLKKRKETYTYMATNEQGGNSSDPNVMKIGVNYDGNNDYDKPESKLHAQLGLIAHETGHKFRQLYGLDPPKPEDGAYSKALNDKDVNAINDYVKGYVEFHTESEAGALHIENIIRSEMRIKYPSIQIRQYYEPQFKVAVRIDRSFGVVFSIEMKVEPLDLFQFLNISPDYYNQKIDVYENLLEKPR